MSRLRRLGAACGVGCLFAVAVTVPSYGRTSAPAAVWVVNSAKDPGTGLCDAAECTLREALVAANGNGPGADVIEFAIPGSVPILMRPKTPLPAIETAVTIDGSTQPGYTGTPIIELDGTRGGNCCSGLRFDDTAVCSNDCGEHRVRGLVINRWASAGILDLSLESTLVVERSYIGTDVTGAAAAGNHGHGISLFDVKNDRPVTIRDSVVSGNGGWGIWQDGRSPLTITGSRLGTDATGTTAISNELGGLRGLPTTLVFGGDSAAERNVVSGNGGPGIDLRASVSSIVVQGNRIGTDITGTLPLGNAGPGVNLDVLGPGIRIGGAAPGEGNVISANGGPGILGEDLARDASGIAVVQGNWIGTDPSGASVLGNGIAGIWLGGSEFVQVGGPGSEANVIAHNHGPGLAISTDGTDESNDVRVAANVFRDNDGLAVDLGDDGVTLNDGGDADDGANHLQNHPVVRTAASNANGTRVTGKLDSAPGTYTVDVYAAEVCGPAGRGQSTIWLGSLNVVIGAENPVRYRATFPTATPAGWVVSATATNGLNTSEYSPCQPVT